MFRVLLKHKLVECKQYFLSSTVQVMSSHEANEDNLVKVLRDSEEVVICELSEAYPVNLCKDLFQACIIY